MNPDVPPMMPAALQGFGLDSTEVVNIPRIARCDRPREQSVRLVPGQRFALKHALGGTRQCHRP